MDLKELLGDLYTEAIAAKVGDKKLVVDDGTRIPKHRLDEVITERDGFKKQVEKSDADLKDLKKAVSGNEELTAKIGELQTANKTIKEEADKSLLNARKSLAVKESLMNEGVASASVRDLLSGKFDINTIELDDKGAVKNFADLVKPVKEDKDLANLFTRRTVGGPPHHEGPLELNPGATKQIAQMDAKEFEAYRQQALSAPRT